MKKQVQLKNEVLKSFLLRSVASLLGQQGTIWALFACFRRRKLNISNFITLLINKESCLNFSILNSCLPTAHVTAGSVLGGWPQLEANPQAICPLWIEKAGLYSSRTKVY